MQPSRRTFLRSVGLAAAGTTLAGTSEAVPLAAANPSRPMVKPRALKPGDTVGLVAPSSYIFDLWKLDEVVARLEGQLGLKAKLGKNVRARHGYMAGTEKERLDDLHAMFADPGVAAVFCLEGGYGTERLLPGLDYGLIRRNPKILLGFSDITGLHLAVGRAAGVVTFHGPVATSRLPPFTLASLKRALFEASPMGEIVNPPEDDAFSPAFPLHTVVPGRARGLTAGGNLTLVSTTMGTPWELDAQGRILFLEDTGEAPYRVDRMLTQLKLAGKFAECAGVVWGTCTDCAPSRSSYEINLSLPDLLDEILGDIGKPVLAGLVFGHTKERSTIPLGVACELDASAKKVAIVEPATVGA